MPYTETLGDKTERFFLEQKWFITEANWIRKQLGDDSALFIQYLRCMLSLQPQVGGRAAEMGMSHINATIRESHFYVRPKILSGTEITPDRDADDYDQNYIRGMAAQSLRMRKDFLLEEFYSELSGKNAYYEIQELYRKITAIIGKNKLDRFNKIFVDWVTWPALIGVCYQRYCSQYYEDLLEWDGDNDQYIFEHLLDRRCTPPGSWSVYQGETGFRQIEKQED